jgi:hypothetical protein
MAMVRRDGGAHQSSMPQKTPTPTSAVNLIIPDSVQASLLIPEIAYQNHIIGPRDSREGELFAIA